MVYKRGAPEVADRSRSTDDGLDGRDGDCRAARSPSGPPTLELDDVPRGGPHATRSSTSSTRSAAGSPRTRPASRSEGRTTMAELGGEPQATVIGSTRGCRRRTRRSRTRCSATASTTTTRTPTRSATSRRSSARRRSPRRESLGASGRDVLTAIVAGNEVVCRIGMAASGRLPRAAASTPPRSAGSSAASRRSPGSAGLDADDDDERARHRRLVRVGGLFAYLADGHADEADAPRLGRARRPPRDAARRRTAPPARRPCSRASSASTTRSSARSEGEVDIDGQLRRPRVALGDAADRVQALPGLPLHARLARRRGRGGRGPNVRAGRDRRRARRRFRRPASRSCSSRRRRRGRRARSTRASSRCSTRSRRCSCAGTSPSRDFTDEAIADPAVLAVAAKVRYETRAYPTYPQAFPGGAVVRLADGTSLEADFPYQQGGPENPLSPDEVREKFRDNASLALARRGGRGARGGASSRSRSRTTSAAALAPLTLLGGRPGVTRSGSRRSSARSSRPSASSSTATSCPSPRSSSTRDEFPESLVETMREMGLFGTTIPEEYGGLGLGLDTYALIVMELSRGWVTLSGILNGSFIAATMIRLHGTEEQRRTYLPRLASCELRSSFSMTEPHAGSDVQAIRTIAVRDGDDYVITGQKMWVTNGWRSGLVMLLAKTDPDAEPAHTGDDRLHRREGARDEPARPRDPDARAAEARLQGRRVDRARLRRLPHARRERPRRRGRASGRGSSTS